MKIFEKQTFEKFYDHDAGAVYEDLEFRRCSFTSSGLSMTERPELRSVVRNVRLIGCSQQGCTIGSPIVEDVLIQDLKTNGLLQAWGAVFRHVMLRGKIDRVMISAAVKAGLAPPAVQREFDVANASFYADVDWALDISSAEFQECTIRGVPARLIRRDPHTQIVVTREKAMAGGWRDLDLSRTPWDTAIQLLLDRGDTDVVLVAGKRSKNFSDLVLGLRRLQDAGTAEPN